MNKSAKYEINFIEETIIVTKSNILCKNFCIMIVFC